MQAAAPSTPEAFFDGHPLGLAAFERVTSLLLAGDPVDVRVSGSQVSLRRRHGFAYLWLPGQYLPSPTADVVLSIVLGRHDPSPRFKEVVHPAPAHWMHHLELHDVGDIDDEVAGWLREAAARAG
jgi:hypothetical protein